MFLDKPDFLPCDVSCKSAQTVDFSPSHRSPVSWHPAHFSCFTKHRGCSAGSDRNQKLIFVKEDFLGFRKFCTKRARLDAFVVFWFEWSGGWVQWDVVRYITFSIT